MIFAEKMFGEKSASVIIKNGLNSVAIDCLNVYDETICDIEFDECFPD
jgi:hypothetical protein